MRLNDLEIAAYIAWAMFGMAMIAAWPALAAVGLLLLVLGFGWPLWLPCMLPTVLVLGGYAFDRFVLRTKYVFG